ncbi:MAG: restriction endonuclease subunit S [Candidatus Dojkabacteria bacterium]|nr:MAG: restriction endonuclease subunit S [Candidatus Dojkabacteria bacterium]
MKKYNNYKQTFVDWIGEIPEQWKVKPLMAVLQQRNEKNDPVKTEQILSLSIADGVTLYSHIGRGGNKSKGDLTAYKIAHEGDIVMNSMNVIVGAVGLSRYFGAISPVYYALFPKDDSVEIKFYENIFKSKAFQKFLMVYGKGILIKKSASGKLNTIRMKVSSTDLRRTLLPVPAYIEQVAIGQALDEANRKIDKVVEGKRQYINLLKEYKQSKINELVTKGLNPNVKMKDSGIEWLGEIPEHWDTLRLKTIISTSKNGIWGEDVNQNKHNYPCIRVADFDYTHYCVKDEILTLRSYADKDIVYLIEEPSVLIEKSGGGEKMPVGRIVYYNSSKPCMCSNFISRIKVKEEKVLLQYFVYFMSVLYSKRVITKSIKATTGIQNIDEYSLFAEKILIPPVNEQSQIVNIIKSVIGKYDQLVEKAEKQIELIQQYRQSLIYELVTGKRKP